MIESIRQVALPDSGDVRDAGVSSVLMDLGRDKAASLKVIPPSRQAAASLRKRVRTVYRAIGSALKATPEMAGDMRWVAENARLLRTASKQIRDIEMSLKEYPAVVDANSALHVRAVAVAAGYLDAVEGKFEDEGLISYLQGFQQTQELQMGELWALLPALQFEVLARIVDGLHQGTSNSFAALVNSLRLLGEAEWKDLFEAVDVVDAALAYDPAGAYTAMDYDSRDMYRNAVARLAKTSRKSEHEVADAAVGLADDFARRHGNAGRAALRRTHVGYYLIDDGEQALRRAIGYRPSLKTSIQDWMLRHSEPFFLLGIEAATLLIAYALLSGLPSLTPIFIGFFLLLLPATQAAVDFMNNLVSYLIRPRALPKLDFSKGVCDECTTMVAVPTLLLNDRQVHELVTDLEIRYLANSDPRLFYALVTDWPDADAEVVERDQIVSLAVELIEGLNRRYGTEDETPFYLFHRHRVFNESEGRWMGWERKRGKLLDLNNLLRGGFDSFPVKVGNTCVLQSIRYVITLDSDTQLPRDAAQRLIGTIAHPLNRAVIDPESKMVVEGYGILQPRIGISIQSAARSWLASIYSGQTGFDIYTRAVSDVYQDLFGEGIFTGKGIYEVDAIRESLEHRFPENALLSHDLIEGAYARAGLASDIELIDDYPSHFSAYSRRKHRWMRGDWQIMRWVLDRVPNRKNVLEPNPIRLISRWKILDNLRRSLFDPATLVLLLSGWFYLPGAARFWTAVSIALLLMPAYANLLFSILRAPWGHSTMKAWAKDTCLAFLREHVIVLLHLVFLLHEAMVACDAIVRSLSRVFWTKRRLLEWETAAEAESATKKRATADVYLAWSPWIALGIGAALYLLRRPALSVAAPVLALWILAGLITRWLNSAPKEGNAGLSLKDLDLLRESSLRMWCFYRDYSNDATNWTIPDHVREDGMIAERLSPTNLGFVLNARIAAVHFGYLTLPEFIDQTRKTLDAIERLPKYRGHVLNWHATDTLEVLSPKFVSSVDSGNLAACLWTLKQAAISFAKAQPAEDVLWSGICDIARVIGASGDANSTGLRYRVLRSGLNWKNDLPALETAAREFTAASSGEAAWWGEELVARIVQTRSWLAADDLKAELGTALSEMADIADSLVGDMDFGFLYNRRKKVLSVGYDVAADRLEPSTYDLLASEARIASFVAIAKGDIPQNSWFHLGRKHTVAGGDTVLVSWTGTMFEYLMPAIWMRNHRDTLIHKSMHAAVRVQRNRMRVKGIPWGVSESGCAGADEACEYGYSAFGIPDLAMKAMESLPRVISPYSTFLALSVDPRAAMDNLYRMAGLGWTGRYGFYESTDYRSGQPRVVRSWMAHHLGMSLLSIGNLLFNNVFQQYFHNDPYVLATELLLHERVPTAMTVEAESAPVRVVTREEAVA